MIRNNHNEKSLRALFVQYLIPSVASLLSLSLYILADTFFISRGVGSVGLAALNIAIPAYSVINATGLMLGIGAGVVYAVARGSGDDLRATRVFNTAVWTAAIVGLVFTVIGVCFSREIALLLGASALSADHAAAYLRAMLSFSVFFLLNNTLGALVRNDGNPRLSMVAMVANSASNVVLDYVFVIRLGWSMGGAALATGLSPVLGLCILSAHWLGGHSSLRLERRLPDFTLVGSIVRGGISNFIIEVGNGLIILLFNFTLMGLAGDTAVAAYGIVANVSLVISYIFTGIGQGMQPVISLRHGQGGAADCRRVLHMGLAVAAVLGVACVAAGLLLPAQLTAIFNSENNLELAAITIPAIRIYFVCFAFMGVNICCASYFQSTLQARVASVISLLRGFVLVALGVMTLPRLLGLTGVWMITPLSEAVCAGLCVWLLLARARSGRALPAAGECR